CKLPPFTASFAGLNPSLKNSHHSSIIPSDDRLLGSFGCVAIAGATLILSGALAPTEVLAQTPTPTPTSPTPTPRPTSPTPTPTSPTPTPTGPGKWVLVKIEGNGKFTEQTGRAGGILSGPVDKPWTQPGTLSDSSTGQMGIGLTKVAGLPSSPHSSENPLPAGGAGVAKVDGKIKVWLKWEGGGVPSKTCYLRVNSEAQGSATTQSTMPQTWSVAANNGFVSESLAGSTSAYSTVWPGISERFGPGRTIVVDTGGARTVDAKELNLSLLASSNLSLTQWSTGQAYANISTRLTPLDYGLTLSRAGAPVPKIEGQFGVVIDPTKDEWIGTDGIGHGHTTYSYNYETDFGFFIMRSYYNWQNFTAGLGSSWPSSATGTWSNPDPSDTMTQHKQSMAFGSPEFRYMKFFGPPEWMGAPTPASGETSIDYTVTDNSTGTPITAKANYKLTLHDEWETNSKKSPFETLRYDKAGVIAGPIVGAPQGTTAIGHGSYKFDWLSKIQQSRIYTFDTKITSGADMTAKLPALKGIDLSATASATLNYGMSSTTTMTDENGQGITATIPLDILPGKNYFLVSQQKFHVHHIPMLRWSSSGFVGEREFTYETSDKEDVNITWDVKDQQPIVPPTIPGG
ncbi:hypothetical protein B1R32_1391, partial [Abditibacterium utsteinense]